MKYKLIWLDGKTDTAEAKNFTEAFEKVNRVRHRSIKKLFTFKTTS